MSDFITYCNAVIEAAQDTIDTYTKVLNDVDGELKYSICNSLNCKYCELFMDKSGTLNVDICGDCPLSHGTVKGCLRQESLKNLTESKTDFLLNNTPYNRLKFQDALRKRRRYHWGIIRDFKDKIEFVNLKYREGLKASKNSS